MHKTCNSSACQSVISDFPAVAVSASLPVSDHVRRQLWLLNWAEKTVYDTHWLDETAVIWACKICYDFLAMFDVYWDPEDFKIDGSVTKYW